MAAPADFLHWRRSDPDGHKQELILGPWFGRVLIAALFVLLIIATGQKLSPGVLAKGLPWLKWW